MTVYLVGAGPGDPGLLTVRGAELLARAEVIVYDRLTASELLDLAPADCRMVHVGKQPGGPSVAQDEINAMLVRFGGDGRCVVRLKGGDPYVFARGAEEAAALEAAGVDYEVVPGISSAFAAPSAAGIPVTMRYSSTHVTVVTGHEDPTKGRTDVNWEAIAAAGGTIVVLMGVGRWQAISERLIAGGLDPDTPAAAVQWGSTVAAAHGACDPGHPGPAAARHTVGDRRGVGGSREARLVRTTPVVRSQGGDPRAREQASKLADRLRSLGAEVVLAPTIEITGPSDGGESLRAAAVALGASKPAWVVFSSANAVDRFFARLTDARDLAGSRVAAIGPGTLEALERCGIRADLVPDRYVAEGLLEVFPAAAADGGRVLLPRAEVARDILVEGLVAKGWTVEVVPTYRTVPAPVDESLGEQVRSADAICFASSSSVTNFVAAYGASTPAVVAAIGPVTAARAAELGLEVSVVPQRSTIPDMVDALAEHFGNPR
ncbi:MAG: uroporphyrinogen-III C-methyltransferase [Microthrixaceae bacterium]